jgi:O-antigen/teichoic acid export membrane protein
MEEGLLKKFINFGYGSILILIINIISIPLLTRLLTPDEYGNYSLFIMSSNIMYIIILFGFEQSFVKFFYDEKNENKSTLLYKCLVIPIIISLFILILYFLFAIFINLSSNQFKFVTFLLIINSILLAGNNFILLIIRMQQKGKLYSMIQAISKGLFLLFIIFFLGVQSETINITDVYYFIILGNLLSLLIAIFNEKDFLKYNTVSKKSSTNFPQLVTFAVPMFITLLINMGFQSLDRFSLKLWTTDTELGIYSAAMTLAGLLSIIQSAFTTFWTPVAFKKYSDNPNEKLFFERINSIVSYIMLIIGVIGIGSKDLFVIFLGESYRESAFIIPFLVFFPLLYTVSETTQIGINFKNKPIFHIYVSIITIVLNLVLLFILVPFIGARGAAISVGFSYILFYLLRTLFSQTLIRYDFKIKKFLISIFLLVLYAFYSTFITFNITHILFAIVLIVFYSYLYNNVLFVIKDYFILRRTN